MLYQGSVYKEANGRYEPPTWSSEWLSDASGNHNSLGNLFKNADVPGLVWRKMWFYVPNQETDPCTPQNCEDEEPLASRKDGVEIQRLIPESPGGCRNMGMGWGRDAMHASLEPSPCSMGILSQHKTQKWKRAWEGVAPSMKTPEYFCLIIIPFGLIAF